MTITFTLTVGSASTDAGPFNISGTTSGNVTYELATGVTKTQLTNGYSVNTIHETITGGTVASTGTCTTTDTWSVTPTPTPTATAGASGVLLDNDFILGMTETSTCPGTSIFNQVYISQSDFDTHYVTGGAKFITLYQDEELLTLYSGYNFVYVNGYQGGIGEVYEINSSSAVIGNPAASQPC